MLKCLEKVKFYYSIIFLGVKPAKTDTNFYKKPPKPKGKGRPVSGYIGKPPTGMKFQ